MIGIYRILFLPALILALPAYLPHMWRRGGYREGLRSRFGCVGKVSPKPSGVKRIWIQAVSVGELNAVGPLLESIAADKDLEAVVTTTTSTGYKLLCQRYGHLVIWKGYFPLDFWLFSRAAWRQLQPDLIVLMEGELWPEHLHQARIRGIPAVLINARLSDRSFKRHFRFRKLTRRWFSSITEIHARGPLDAERLRELGWVSRETIHTSGNLKMDLSPVPPLPAVEHQRRLEELGFHDIEDPIILLGSSTWPKEEALLVESYLTLSRDFPNLRLLIVPRHAERRAEVKAVVAARKLPFHLRSSGLPAPRGTRVYIADTTGELKDFTRLSDLVFIGKSLPPNEGGQTPIEAAAAAKPIVMGPRMSNFRHIAKRLVAADGALQIPGPDALTTTLAGLLVDPEIAARLGQAAAALIQENRGATKRQFERLRCLCLSKTESV